MTEAEWLSARNPERMLRYLRAEASERKLQLFACAAACEMRTHASWQGEFPSTDALEATAGGTTFASPRDGLMDFLSPMSGTIHLEPRPDSPDDAVGVGSMVTSISRVCDIEAMGLFNEIHTDEWGIIYAVCVENGNWVEYGEPLVRLVPIPVVGEVFYSVHCPQHLHEIFGNPFRHVVFSSEWRTSTATLLANHIYDTRDFSAMPILADALQDAGCDSDDILTHCRDETQVHVRGCWVVDLILGKP